MELQLVSGRQVTVYRQSVGPYLWTLHPLSERSNSTSHQQTLYSSRKQKHHSSEKKQQEFNLSSQKKGLIIPYHLVEIQFIGNPISSLFKLFFHPHYVQGIQTVEYGSPQGHCSEYTGAVAPLAYRPQFVLSPSVFDIIVPRMLSHLKTKRYWSHKSWRERTTFSIKKLCNYNLVRMSLIQFQLIE